MIFNLKYLRNIYALGLSLLMSVGAFAQFDPPPRPASCSDAPNGEYGKLDRIRATQTAYCSDFDNPEETVTVRFDKGGNSYTNATFYFQIPDDFDPEDASTHGNSRAVSATTTGNVWEAQDLAPPGYQWVMATAEAGGQKYRACTYIEVIPKTPPVVEFSTCDPTQIEITILDDPRNQHSRYVFNWGAGPNEELDATTITLPHTITRPNTGQQVSISGTYIRLGGSVCPTSPAYIDPDVAQVPFINYLDLVTDGSDALIKFEDYTTDKEYPVQFAVDNGAGYDWQDAGKAVNGEVNYAGLNAGTNYCFRIGEEDKCGNTSYSEPVCTSYLNGLQSSSQDVQLNWNIPSNPNLVPTRILLEKRVENCTNPNPSACFNAPFVGVFDTSFGDAGLDCENVYSYKLRYTYKTPDGKDIVIWSNKLEIDPKSGSVRVTPIDLVSVGYLANDEEVVDIVVYRNNFEAFEFYRSEGYSNDFISIGSTSSNDFEDISVNPNAGAYCYKYDFEDECGTISELSPEFCTIFLEGDASKLTWTPYTFPSSVVSDVSDVEYIIEVYDPNANTWIPRFTTTDTAQGIFNLVSNSNASELKFRIQGKQFVTTVNSSTGQFIFSYSNTVVIKIPPNVFLPSAFTPNADGHNETFFPFSKFVQSGEIIIYDRWGSILFQSDDMSESWNGTLPDGVTPAPIGNYAYSIKGESDAGEKFSKKGTLTLLR